MSRVVCNLHLRVQFRTQKHDEGPDVEPEHQRRDRPERALGLVEVGEARDIGAERHQRPQPENEAAAAFGRLELTNVAGHSSS
jgi:hypothetical protein